MEGQARINYTIDSIAKTSKDLSETIRHLKEEMNENKSIKCDFDTILQSYVTISIAKENLFECLQKLKK